MPQIIGLVLIGAGVYSGYKAFQRLAAGLSAPARSEAEPVVVPREKDLGRLVRDPETGVYRPLRHPSA